MVRNRDLILPFALVFAGGCLNHLIVEDPAVYWVILVLLAVALGLALRGIGRRAVRREEHKSERQST